MKKLLLSLVAVFAVATASAQEFSWGIKAGANLSSVYGKDVTGVTGKVDFVGGAFVEYKTCQWFGIGAEVLYSGQGFKSKDLDVRADLSYINVPILANFHVAKFISLKTGVQPGFLVASKANNGELDKNQLNKFDLSIPVGIGFQLDCGLLFDLRYNIGVTTVIKDGAKAYNDVVALTVGWRF